MCRTPSKFVPILNPSNKARKIEEPIKPRVESQRPNLTEEDILRELGLDGVSQSCHKQYDTQFDPWAEEEEDEYSATALLSSSQASTASTPSGSSPILSKSTRQHDGQLDLCTQLLLSDGDEVENEFMNDLLQGLSAPSLNMLRPETASLDTILLSTSKSHSPPEVVDVDDMPDTLTQFKPDISGRPHNLPSTDPCLSPEDCNELEEYDQSFLLNRQRLTFKL